MKRDWHVYGRRTSTQRNLDPRVWARWIRNGDVAVRPSAQIDFELSYTDVFAHTIVIAPIGANAPDKLQVRWFYDSYSSSAGVNTGTVDRMTFAADLVLAARLLPRPVHPFQGKAWFVPFQLRDIRYEDSLRGTSYTRDIGELYVPAPCSATDPASAPRVERLTHTVYAATKHPLVAFFLTKD